MPSLVNYCHRPPELSNGAVRATATEALGEESRPALHDPCQAQGLPAAGEGCCGRSSRLAGEEKILKNADLRTLSSKQVRLQLQAKFGLDLSSRKQEIDDILMSIINADDTETADGGGGNSFAAASGNACSAHQDEPKSDSRSSSESDESDDSGPVEATGSVKRKKKKKDGAAKRSAAADAGDVSSGLDDEALARKLHNEELRVRQRKLDKKGKRVKNGKSEDGSSSASTAGPKRGKSVYSQECVLSPELASVMGTDKMARKDVVSKMWKIFKERNLIDPKNKQYVICDQELEKLFKTKKFRAFGMMKFLKHHMKDAKLVQS